VWAYSRGETHRRAWPQYILRRLRLTQNVKMSDFRPTILDTFPIYIADIYPWYILCQPWYSLYNIVKMSWEFILQLYQCDGCVSVCIEWAPSQKHCSCSTTSATSWWHCELAVARSCWAVIGCSSSVTCWGQTQAGQLHTWPQRCHWPNASGVNLWPRLYLFGCHVM